MRRVLGLRGRVLLALVATSAVTLLAAALALLNPLQARLREQSAKAIADAVQSSRAELDRALRDGRDTDAADAADRLARRTGSRVTLFDATHGLRTVDPSTGSPFAPIPRDDRRDDVYAVLVAATPRTVISQTDDGPRLAVPLDVRPRRGEPPSLFVLAVRKPNTDLTETVDQVRSAFASAALVGLGASVIIGLGLSTALLRRLRRLRSGALRLLREGLETPVRLDTRSDEVGDVGRALSAMQQGLLRQERARRQFVATASHELRTPLTSLSGTLELLLEDLESDQLDVADARGQVQGARAQLERLRNLATELLDLSRLDAGVALRSEPVELAEIARAVAAEFAHTGREVGLVAPRGPCWAGGDPDAVARVVRILLDNALRYSPAGTPVAVQAAYRGERAVVEVVDHGPGVPEDERELVFERFGRGRGSTRSSGFGLGLAIGRELAERQGGTLELAAGEQTGSRFILSLPIELPSGSAGAAEPADAGQAASRSGSRS